MQVHTLRFGTREQFSWAFRYLLDQESVDDCLAEPDLLRIRFVAEPGHVEMLLERVYLQGGLVWCEVKGIAAPRGTYGG